MAAAAASSQVAYGGTKDGSVIFGNLCSGCHGSGAGGAPTLDHAHWDARIAKGKDTLHKHAIEGFQGAAGVMPAKGGNPALTDEQVMATVDWMLGNLRPIAGGGLLVFATLLGAGVFLILGRARQLNLLALGEEPARQLGLTSMVGTWSATAISR